MNLARSTVTMTVLTAVSRMTGLVRILLVGAVVGTTYLGNTYQSTNTVPNIIFELMAAGTFQAVLIPALVRYEGADDRDAAEHLAASVLGIALAALVGVAAIGMVASPLVTRVLFAGSPDAVRAEQVRLGTIFLLIFLPQVAMYAIGMVATGVLNSQNRFAAPAIAPAVNNVIVSIAYVLFWVSRDGAPPSLDLTPLQIALLAGGTTLGVVGFCAVPYVAMRRTTSFHLGMAFDHRNPEIRRVLRMGVWAAGFLASTQLLIVAELVLSNRIEGGVVALQIGWTFFLLPYALFAQPVLTALFPTMSRQSAGRDHGGLGASIESGTEMISLFVIPAAISFVAVAPATCRAVLFGEIDAAGAAEVARVVVAFAPGTVGYGLLLFYARVRYAAGDARTPTIVNLGAGIVGAAVMFAAFGLPPLAWRVPLLAAVHAAAYTLGAVALLLICRADLPAAHRPHLLRRLRPQLLALVPVSIVGVAIGRSIPLASRGEALVGALAVGLGIYVLFVGAVALLGGPRPQTMLRSIRGGATA